MKPIIISFAGTLLIGFFVLLIFSLVNKDFRESLIYVFNPPLRDQIVAKSPVKNDEVAVERRSETPTASSVDINFDADTGFSITHSQGDLYTNTSDEADVVINRTENGYEPMEVTIQKGDVVEWRNGTSDLHWPASNQHPIHGDYPEFDPTTAIIPGESWSFQFNQVGIWKYHDHVNARVTGTITVIE